MSDDDDQGETVSLPVLVRTMAVMATADGRIDPGEVKGIAALLSEMTGEDIDHETVRAIVADEGVDSEGFIEELRALAPGLDEAGKDIIIVAGLMVATADGELDPPESDLIGKMAAALGLSDEDVKALVVDLLAEE